MLTAMGVTVSLVDYAINTHGHGGDSFAGGLCYKYSRPWGDSFAGGLYYKCSWLWGDNFAGGLCYKCSLASK